MRLLVSAYLVAVFAAGVLADPMWWMGLQPLLLVALGLVIQWEFENLLDQPRAMRRVPFVAGVIFLWWMLILVSSYLVYVMAFSERKI